MLIEMMIFIAEILNDYQVNDIPTIFIVPKDNLVQACGQNCLALYHPLIIQLSDTLDIDNSRVDQGILLHELVHHHQEMRGRWLSKTICEQLNNREKEAYAVQNIWYQKNDINFKAQYRKRC